MPGTPPVVNALPPSSILGAGTPGTFADVVISGTDADNLVGSIAFPVQDSQGNAVNATVSLTISDPLTFGTAVIPAALAGKVSVNKISTAPDGLSATYRITVL